ncbi:MAG: EAL domain-containing protein [Bacteroidota bacterium]
MRDAFVITAMSLVVVAIGFSLHVQLNATPTLAILGASLAWALFFWMHLRIRRASVPVAVSDEIARLSQEIASVKQASSARLGQAPARGPRIAPPLQQGAAPTLPPPLPPPLPPFSKDDAGSPVRAAQRVPAPAEHPESPPMGRPSADRPSAQGNLLPAKEQPAAAEKLGWDLRPGREPLPTAPRAATFPPLPSRQEVEAGAPHRSAASAAIQQPELPLQPQPAPRREPADLPPPDAARSASRTGASATPAPQSDADNDAASAKAAELRSMQSLIEQIAKQLKAPAETQAPADTGSAAPGMSNDQIIAQSVEALKAAGGAMRAASTTAAAPARPARERPAAPSNGVAQIGQAIAGERIDTYLDYVFGLEDRKARHFEISVRIRTEDGRSLGVAECAPLLASGGLHGRLDAARLVRLVKIAERLNSRGANAVLFSSLAPQSLVDDTFLDTCANALRNRAAVVRQLVLSFSQGDVRVFGKAHWETLATLAQNGVRFGIEDLTDLAMDFGVLNSRGFVFARADAAVLLAGMQAHDGLLAAPQVSRRLADAGFGLIACAIRDEAAFARVAKLGVLYGQGPLFGSAPVKIDLKQQREAAA